MKNPTLSLTFGKRYGCNQLFLLIIFMFLLGIQEAYGFHNNSEMSNSLIAKNMLHVGEDSYTSINIVNSKCCNNATNTTNGQFEYDIEIIGQANTIWYVVNAIGYYQPNACAAMAPAPIPFLYGLMGNGVFTADSISPDSSKYTLRVLTVHGELNQIRLQSSRSDIVTIVGQSEKYEIPEVEGPISMCSGETVAYSAPDGYTNHSWEIIPPTAGTIDDDTSSDIIVSWMEDGDFELIYSGTPMGGGCVAPLNLAVVVGTSLGNSMKCRGPMNLSLANSCELLITPEMVLTDSHDPDEAPYAVMIMDLDGSVIPQATFTYKEVGNTYEVKVIDGCSKNSCWTMITVEDKYPPQIICSPDTIELSCHRVNQYTGPLVEDNCDLGVKVSVIDSSIVYLDCDSNYVSAITKKYIAIDKFGNESSICDQTIMVKRVELDSIKAPAGFIMAQGTGLSCSDYPGGAPGPEITGVPTLDGHPVYPMDANGICNVVSTYRDEEVGNIGCTRKIIRTWTIYEWYCDSPVEKKFEQFIEITDTVPPVILSELEDITVSADLGECQAMVLLPAILTEDACFDEDVKVIVKDRLNTNGGVIILEEGVHDIKYIVTDQCGNSDSLAIEVTVVDKTPPVAVCLEKTTVALDIFGNGYAPAEIFDRGSHDACGVDSFDVRRMQDLDVTCIDIPADFGPYVEFCCDDAGKVRLVEMRVWDVNGNSNTCMIEVTVQDKFPPKLTVPADQTLACGSDYDLNDLSQFGAFIVEDACGVTIDSVAIDSISTCGTGRILRTFIVSDANGTTSGTQEIQIINKNPFEMDPSDWPLNYDTDAFCGDNDVDPDNLPDGHQRPKLENDLCSSVTATFYDDKYPFPGEGSDACFKILRKWSVIDWCQEDINGVPRKWTYNQVIKIRNTDKPLITSDLSPVTVCSSTCDGGPIVLGAKAFDTCTIAENLTWEYAIDYFDDGSIDSTFSGDGDTVTIDGMFTIGTHSVLWTFRDQCGNTISERQLFSIEDCNGPVASAIDGFSIGLVPMDLDGNDGIPDTEMACIIADTVNASSYHPCGIPITFSFSRDTTDKEMCFDCFDLGINTIYLYVTDIFGNVDSVKFTIDIQDNNNVDICEDPTDCVVFPADTSITSCDPDLSPAGLASMPIIDPNCICDNFTTTYMDDTLTTYPGSNCLYLIRNWTVTFDCGRNPVLVRETQEITLFNIVAPTITCPPGITVSAAGTTCAADVNLQSATATGMCNTGIIITNNYNNGGANASGTYPVGDTEVVFVAVDACGNADTCSIIVTVQDAIDPICNVQDVTVTLDGNGGIRIDENDVDNGSKDTCGVLTSFTLSRDTFDCSDIGVVPIDITITDNSGNEAICMANVTVLDTISPICQTNDLTIVLNTTDTRYFTVDEIDNNSSDPCGVIVNRSISRDSVTCADSGLDVITVLTVEDNSGNTSSCEAIIKVTDNIAPICMPKDITIGVGAGGMTTILPDTIDDGSFDNCGVIVKYELDDSTFMCADIGTQTVILTVTDDSNNSSSCSASVTVNEITEITCQTQNVTVYLDDNGMASITVDDINNGSSAGCSETPTLSLDDDTFDCNDILGSSPVTVNLTVTTTSESTSCQAQVTVLDTVPPTGIVRDTMINCEDNDGNIPGIGGFTPDDNCAVVSIDTMITDSSLDICGIGFVKRRFILEDASGNVTTTIEQMITIQGSSDFGIDDINFPDNVVFVEDCNAPVDPVIIGSEPTIDEANCARVTIDFVDNLISSGSSACADTIERIWTVVDSCQFDAMTMSGIWRDTQLIIITDTVAPVIIGPADVTIENNGSVDNCVVSVNLGPATATDNCSDVGEITISHDGEGNQNSTFVSGDYAPGVHTITFTATDKCGNTGTYSFNLTVEDPSGSGIVCTKVVAEIGDDGTRTLRLDQFSVFIPTACYDPTGLNFAFDREDEDSVTTTFFCEDVDVNSPGNALGLDVNIYAFEMGTLVDSCLTTVDVTDNSGNDCAGNNANLIGNVATPAGDEVEGVTVFLESDRDIFALTNGNGEFAFQDLLFGSEVTVIPTKNNDVLNGVTTLDLLMIQRHMLGLQEITEEHLLIAADIDHSMHISATDILALRKTILGIYDEFPNNQSWRMIDASYDFPEANNPFAEQWPEQYTIHYLTNNMNVGFVGVKIGDISGDAIVNNKDGLKPRSNLKEVVTVERTATGMLLKASRDIDIAGFQFATYSMNDDIQIESDLANFSSKNYIVSDNQLKMSWSTTETESLDKGQVILEIQGENITGELLAGSLFPEIYIVESGTIHTYELSLEEISQGLGITSVIPNPWSEFTNVSFNIAYDDQVIVNFYDASGRQLLQRRIDAVSGRNVFRVNKNEIPISGLLYYDVISSKDKSQGKMIVIK